MMNINEVLHGLCLSDSRNPDYSWLWEDYDEAPTPRKNCHCDNCHYGRDKLAVYILELYGKVRYLYAKKGRGGRKFHNRQYGGGIVFYGNKDSVIKTVMKLAQQEGVGK